MPSGSYPTPAASKCFNYCSQSKSVTSAIVPYCLGSTSVGGTWWVFLNGAASGTKPFSSLCFSVEYGGWAFLPHGQRAGLRGPRSLPAEASASRGCNRPGPARRSAPTARVQPLALIPKWTNLLQERGLQDDPKAACVVSQG